ncbi:hypothetical protein [Pseudoalteromonas sp. SR41-1]|uniref:hypothetical protein n=1 Tax=Pseudoalteromonas sp. SR41-1 TaxID=2760952 RepID=UPI0016018428|nr:hypothetical protein [Pseudoalteromonas sp. SR41-1]MBB1282710.1 hypothetical protein [Pseudoalteromonas sp. SR41-1]
MKLLSFFLMILFISGCANSSREERLAEEKYWEYVEEYTAALKQPTPSIISSGAIFNFVYLNSKAEIIRTVTAKLTNEKVRSCSMENALKMEILVEQPERKPIFAESTEIAAYSVLGGSFHFSLRANICDGGMDVHGTVDEFGFAGEEVISSWPCPDIEKCPEPISNLVVGAPVQPNNLL